MIAPVTHRERSPLNRNVKALAVATLSIGLLGACGDDDAGADDADQQVDERSPTVDDGRTEARGDDQDDDDRADG